nr:HAMP domain-containing sensor histidine kinase [Nostoc punctiforme]
MKLSVDRIGQIVLSLRNFSRLDDTEKKPVDIHQGIDNTLMILQHRLKANSERPAIEVIKNYGVLPLITCYAGQLNQVFTNLLANAIDALEDVDCAQDCLTSQPQISIHTEIVGDHGVRISIADNGVGMTESVHAL